MVRLNVKRTPKRLESWRERVAIHLWRLRWWTFFFFLEQITMMNLGPKQFAFRPQIIFGKKKKKKFWGIFLFTIIQYKYSFPRSTSANPPKLAYYQFHHLLFFQFFSFLKRKKKSEDMAYLIFNNFIYSDMSYFILFEFCIFSRINNF